MPEIHVSEPSHMYVNHPPNTVANQKFNSPERTGAGDPKCKGKFVCKTSNQPSLLKASGVLESKNVDYSYQSQEYAQARTVRKAPHEFFGANEHIASAGCSAYSGFPSNLDPSGRNQQPQYPYPSRPSSVPVRLNSAPGNLYPPNVLNHAYRPMPSRPEVAPFPSAPFTTAPDMGKLSISECSNYVQSSPNLQQQAGGEVKPNISKHSSFVSRNLLQKGPNMNTNHPSHRNTLNGRSSEPGCKLQSLSNPNVAFGACVKQGAGTFSPPSEHEQGLAGVILLALDSLRNEKIIPTEANIADCIRFGNPKHRSTDVKKALDCAVKQQMVVKQILGQVQLYVFKNQLLWKCVNPMGGNSTEYPKTTWDKIQEFLISSDGRSAVTASACWYEAAIVLKNSCLQDLALGQVLQILNLLITVKRWIKHHQSGWKPVTITVTEGDTES